MTIITKKKAIKFAGFQLVIIVTLISIQMALQFASSYKWVGFAKKDESTWIGIAETAQADSFNLQKQLDQCIQDKHTAIEAANPELYEK